MPDPAALYCERIGGELRVERDADGAWQYLACVLPDGTTREEWELYCTDCPDADACYGWDGGM
jgi:putative hemolysin